MELRKMSKLVKLPFLDAFWIARFGDWLYLFDYPSGALMGRPMLSPPRANVTETFTHTNARAANDAREGGGE